jgi:hypothetical protein
MIPLDEPRASRAILSRRATLSCRSASRSSHAELPHGCVSLKIAADLLPRVTRSRSGSRLHHTSSSPPAAYPEADLAAPARLKAMTVRGGPRVLGRVCFDPVPRPAESDPARDNETWLASRDARLMCRTNPSLAVG